MHIPGPRTVRAIRDGQDGRAVVVACPPHPQHGGDRSDARLRAVCRELPAGVDGLRFDYGPYDGGGEERADVRAALTWARERYPRVGLFGYSFGASMALATLGDGPGEFGDPSGAEPPDAASVLAPPSTVAREAVLSGTEHPDCPLQVVYGQRDDTVDWQPVVDLARARGHTVERVSGDHLFVGQRDRIATLVAGWLAERLLRSD